ncbi:MAG TPA: VOC family protein [Bryobacteraceae bacterium]|nr:VOC family protein [Bryobacteraceae bacterium]
MATRWKSRNTNPTAGRSPTKKALDGPRIARRMSHVGILVGALGPAMKFYRDILGFEEIWRGNRDPKRLDWVNMRVTGWRRLH